MDSYYRRQRKKFCRFCKDDITIDYKNVDVLKRYLSDKGKIRARRVTGTCAQHQRALAMALKRAREVAFIPYRIVSASSPGRGRGRGR
ncbi:MAG: 30S ribosomal protein S18 [Terriglobia bacterium]